MADMTVHLADATQIARIVAKIMTADKLSKTLTVPQVDALPCAANEAITLLQDAATGIEALGMVAPPEQQAAEPDTRAPRTYDPASTTALITERAASWDHDKSPPATAFGFGPAPRRM